MVLQHACEQRLDSRIDDGSLTTRAVGQSPAWSGPQADDGCESSGQFIPFPKTEADRVASGDPRPSIEERYPTFERYQHRVAHAITEMVEDRLMLCEDAAGEYARLIALGLAQGVPAPSGPLPAESPVPLCDAGKEHHGHDRDEDIPSIRRTP